MAVFTVNYSLTPGFASTVTGGAGGDDVLVLNWGAATINQGLGGVDKPDSQIGQVLIQGSFGRSCRDPWIDERSGMVLS